MTEKPDYVRNFSKPIRTEIKHIQGNWYLYEATSKYDPKKKRAQKISGRCLGAITSEGFKPSRPRKKKLSETNEVVEFGASYFFYQISEDIRERLSRIFLDRTFWITIYILAILRIIYGPIFKRMDIHYEDSILSHIFKDISISPSYITSFLAELGRNRTAIREFMKEDMNNNNRFIIFDGHRLLSSSRTMDNAEIGYDSKKRYKPQINLIYVFSLGEKTSMPAYYKQYSGSLVDVRAFSDVINESDAKDKNCTVIADKGFGSSENFKELENSNIKYIVPLRRGNQYVSGKVPNSSKDYTERFIYHDRTILSITIQENNFNIHLYFDAKLFSEELNSLGKKTDKNDENRQNKAEKEKKLRQNKKGKLTDEELNILSTPTSNKDMMENHSEMGTITIKTNRTDLNSSQVYHIYKQRQKIEDFFKTYDNTIEFNKSYMRNNYSEEAWLFINHISSMLCMRSIEEIANLGESKNISFQDLAEKLQKVRANKIDGIWSIVPCKRKIETFCSKMGLTFSNDVFQELHIT